ncbi:magnesium/cobalt transporter CorA [Prolixibacteraceae bacterium]|nr:magnesium/cobalt transporter CorA [Prolixibacteraceae bacterium]
MARFVASKKEYIGLSPDSIYFRGVKKADNATIHLLNYDESELTELFIPTLDELNQHIDKQNSWINISGLDNEEFMRNVSNILEIDPVIISETLHTQSRPTVIDYDDCLYVSAKMVMKGEEKNSRYDSENVVFVLKDKQLITFQEKEGDVFEPVRERIRSNKKRVRLLFADYLMYTLLDVIIDNYTLTIGDIGEQIEELDIKLLRSVNEGILSKINVYKRELIFMQKSIVPCKDMIFNLVKIDSAFVHEDSLIFFKELQGNINQSVDLLVYYKEILTSQLNVYHTLVSNKLNDIMKFLTVFSVVFIPLTFIAGIYGTNFEFIPELRYRYSYPLMLLLMLVIAIIMLIYFRRKKWI